MKRIAAIRRVIANPAVMAAEGAYALFNIVLHGTWLAGLVYAFNRGGVGEAGLAAFLVSVPGALSAPVLSVLGSRVSGNRALALGLGGQALASATAGLLMLSSDGSAAFVYVFWSIALALETMARPTILAMLPTVVRSPTELAAANSVLDLVERIGILLGPMIAGFILFRASPSLVFLIAGGLLFVAAVLGFSIGEGQPDHEADMLEVGSAFSDFGTGFRLLRNEPSTRLLVMLLASILIIFGALDVAFITIAVEQLGRDEGTVGILAAAIGVGGIIGAALTFSLIGRRRLTTPIIVGLLAVAVPIMAVGSIQSLPLVVLVLAVTGLGRPILEVAGRTLIQGLSSEDTMAGIFGLLEGLALLAVAVGALGFSIAATSLGSGWALFLAGALLPVFLAGRFRNLRKIDEARPEVDPKLLELMRTIPIFAPLPAFQVEQLLVNMQPIRIAPNVAVFQNGDRGDALFVVTDGYAVIELAGGEVNTERGGFFGEIALIKDQPRMATVRAGADGLEAYSLGRDTFLTAISGVARSRARTHREIDRRLEEG